MAADEDEAEIRVEPDGTKKWFQYGVLHREDGPAVERPRGERWWYQFGQLHREDGPAIERWDGSKEWHLNGKVHRTDGPACVRADGTEHWYLNGEAWYDGPTVVARQKAERARVRMNAPKP